MSRRLFLLILIVSIAATPAALRGADAFTPKAEHVILVVWDGMRPDFINGQNTPNLEILLQRGTFFANNHSFYPTTTEVNGTVLATGAFPSRSHIVANREYRPDLDPRSSVAMEAAETVRKGDALTGGKYLGVSTVAEIARRAGLTTAVAGTKPVALLHDRSPDRPASPLSTIVFAGKSLPESLLAPITSALGPFPIYQPNPAEPKPNTEGNRWTTRALLEHLWHEGVPRYSVLWLSDPDFPQHLTAPGNAVALAGIHDSDSNLGAVVAELQKRGELDKTDIFVVSDHGFSTIDRTVDPTKYFTDQGVPVSRQFTSPPAPGQVISVNVGGTTGLYVIGHDQTVIGKLVELLERSDFAGPIFTREASPGTFSLGVAHLDSPTEADIVFSFRWDDSTNAEGAPGQIAAEGRTGSGMHGSLGKSDIHNTLVGAGPDLRAGFRDELPTGNIDVAPTILRLLNLTSPDGVDGRVLQEALDGATTPTEKPVTKRVEATRQFTTGLIFKDTHIWKQELQTTSFAGHTYIDEGNASWH